MPLKINSKFGSHTRRLCASALLAAFVLSIIFVTAGGPSAHAQRKGKQSANDNASATKAGTTKRVFVGGSSSTPQGSRVTIKSDNPLNDYSSYRSGDRFVVVVPGANAGSVAKGASGRGFSDMQVQQRGKDVVLSYKVQPGAKPRVEQKFNRLDVVFEAAEGSTPAQADNSRNAKPTTAANKTPVVNVPSSNQTSTPAQSQSTADRNAGRPTAAGTGSGQTGSTSTPTGASAPVPDVTESLTQTQPQPVAEQSPASTPASTPAAEQQLAQAQPPTTTAPITTTTTTTQPSATTGTSIGAVVLRNWPLALTLALLVVGVGLFFAARRSSSAAERAPQPEKVETDAALKAARPAKLKDALSTVEAKRAAETSTVAAVTSVASKTEAASDSRSAKQKREDKKKKKRKGRTEAERPGVVARPTVAQEAETVAPVETEIPTTEATAVSSTETAISSAEATGEVVPTETVAQEAALTSSVAALSSSVAASEEAEPTAKDDAAEAARSIEPAVSLDGDVIQVETHRLLEGEPFDERVVGTSDVLARQMIATELLSALASRNEERRERARTAFLAHGYFDEALKDLNASAPAERASAARALGLSGERAATPRLVSALEDSAVEVRRAAVEALASLRDPSAVEPLEALLERENKSKTKVNRKLVQHAVEACREGFAETPAVPAAVEPAAASVAEVTAEAEAVPAAETITALEAAPAIEEAAPAVEEIPQSPATETAPELLVTEDASVETVAPETAFEDVEAAVESPVFEAPATETEHAVGEATSELAPVEDEAAVEELEAVEEAAVSDVAESFEATPVETATTVETEEVSEVAAPQAFAESAREVEVEEFTLTPPPVEAESFEPVSEVKGVEALAEPSLPFAETAVESTTSEVEHAEAAFVEPTVTEAEAPAVEPETEEFGGRPGDVRGIEATEESPAVSVAETAVEPVRDEETSGWVELDMSEAETPARQLEPSAAVFETSGGGALSDADAARPGAETRVEEYAAVETPEVETGFADEQYAAPASSAAGQEKSVELFDEFSTVPTAIQQRLVSGEPDERAGAILELSRLDTSEAFHQICAAFDDEAREVRSAAARALYGLREDRADSFTRALRESDAERRRNIGVAISASGLAGEAIGQLTGESREKTYEAFSLLFLMAKAGEVQPLIRAIEGHPSNEVRLAVVKLLALSGQKEVLPAFRRLAVRGSLPTEVRSAVMEAIYQISSSGQPDPTHAA